MGALRGTWLVTGRPRRAATTTGKLRRSVRGNRIAVGPANRRGSGRPTVGLSRPRQPDDGVPCQQGRFGLLMWSYLLYLFHFNFLQSMICHDEIGCCKKHLLQKKCDGGILGIIRPNGLNCHNLKLWGG
jgi:hypothetical protein